MARPCRYCGAFISNQDELELHESIHRDLDFLNGTNVNDEDQKDVTTYSCQQCQKTYRQKKQLKAHILSKHSRETFSCPRCNKSFEYRSNKTRHLKSCQGTDHVCSKCGKRCRTAHGLRQHLRWHDNSPKARAAKRKAPHTTSPDPSRYRCRRCVHVFDSRHELYLHSMRHHYQTGGALQHRPWRENEAAPWNGEDGNVDDGLREVYEANEALILQQHRLGPVQSVYNFPLNNDVSVDQLMRYAEEIYRREQRAFRANLVFGVILRNRENGQHRYFVPYNNNAILERPLFVSRRTDLRRLRLQLERMDITNELLRNRPDTKWIPVLVTNVHFTVYSTYYPLGQGIVPDYLLKKESIYPLVKSQKTGRAYEDNLCAFRCLALHRGYDIKAVEGPALEYYRQWMSSSESRPEFQGLSFEDFPDFETRFNVNMEVYSLEEDGFALSVYKSRGVQDTTMFVNAYENHLSYIRDFAKYAKKYRCKTCDRHFDRSFNLHRHQRKCSQQTKYVFPGGFHQPRDSIFDKLDQFGINVPEDQRTFPWFICYDFEALLRKVSDKPTDFLQWTQQHVPVSVSLCSNIEGHTDPFCIVEPDQDKLVQSMIAALTEMADRVFELSEGRWGWVLQAIAKKVELESPSVAQSDSEDEDKDKSSHPLTKLYAQFESYMSRVPVLGFNSAKYDLNLIKRTLAKYLNLHDGAAQGKFVVKQNNAYTCIAAMQLKFLDITHYLAPGSSYASFLKAYGVKENKGFFPYEWFDDLTKLDSPTLPAHEAFYSSLKDQIISETDYRHCQKVWTDNEMSTFRDFLVWYNNLDVGPFVLAVQRFQQFFFDKGIDVFKTAISVPGVARQLLFRSAREQNVSFALYDLNNSDLYQTVKQNIVGGPSIIFCRHHRSGETRIRGKKVCKSIIGFDANALYLQAIGQQMPVGPFVRRSVENQFRAELRDKYMSAYYWMDWLMHTQGINIQHKLNFGREVRAGKYPVDGYSPGSKPTVFQFHGCYWHGHDCDVTKHCKNEKWKSGRIQKLKKTEEITQSLEAQGFTVVEMWECQFREYCRDNPEIRSFIDSMRPTFFRNRRGSVTEKDLLNGVVKGELFGMVEVDIEVPEEWPSYCQHPVMTPREYFREMSPLFCTTDVPFEAMGEHMRHHVEKANLSKAPRRLLVGGTKAQRLLLATPLLAWYLRHGMVVTKIYQVVEFLQRRCFETFVKEVSDARRRGDVDPDTGIIGDTMKVVGNAGYGMLLLDKTKHRDIEYVQGENETSLKVNESRFRKLECLDQEEQYYEIEMAKRRINLDLPVQLGYFILQYAKLRMLEFYYDFMDVYVSREDFEYCEMDTDSAYMAISGSSLEDVIKPEMRERYLHGLRDFCIDTSVEADAQFHWFPRTCCSKHAKYDKRTPGLFKLEYQGDEMIELCSKTYIIRKEKIVKPSSSRIAAYKSLRRSLKKTARPCPIKKRKTQEYKFSSKGVSKRILKSPMSVFRRALRTAKAQSGTNRGFRVRKNTIFTYTQEKKGFGYFYCKRKVLSDGIHTEPLDITLRPQV